MNDKSRARGDTISELWSLYARKEGKEQMPPAKTNKQPQNKNTNLRVMVSFYLLACSDLGSPEKRAASDELSGSG